MQPRFFLSKLSFSRRPLIPQNAFPDPAALTTLRQLTSPGESAEPLVRGYREVSQLTLDLDSRKFAEFLTAPTSDVLRTLSEAHLLRRAASQTERCITSNQGSVTSSESGPDSKPKLVG